MRQVQRAILACVLVALSLNAAARQAAVSRTATPVHGYRVVNSYPHDPGAYTQGLVYVDGLLYESTGLNGRSSVRKVRLETGEVIARTAVEAAYFAEGLTQWRDKLIQLTWQGGTGFVYDRTTLRIKGTFAYRGEGWGLTHDGARLILSDGTATLRFLDPESFRETGRIVVREGGQPVTNLNELEFIKGEVYANVWHSNRIARISLQSGEVQGWIDLTGLLPKSQMANSEAVLNGIAYDSTQDRLFVTGKLWPRLFEIRVVGTGVLSR